MISYRPFWETLKDSDETTYTLVNVYGISNSILNRLRKNENVNMKTINALAYILKCSNINQIVEYIPDPSDAKKLETDYTIKTSKEDKIDWEKTIKKTDLPPARGKSSSDN